MCTEASVHTSSNEIVSAVNWEKDFLKLPFKGFTFHCIYGSRGYSYKETNICQKENTGTVTTVSKILNTTKKTKSGNGRQKPIISPYFRGKEYID